MSTTEIFNPPHIPEQTTLRNYQKECIDKIEQAKEGSYLIVLPTGAGKTYVFSHIPRHGRVLILSHREELVYQPKKYYDCSFGVEKAESHSDGEEVVSASVQSLIRRLENFDKKDFDLIITDEAHHSTAPSYKKIYDYFEPRIHLGFTATPDRADKQDLNKVYDEILYFKDIKWGIEEKFLTDINCLRVDVGYDLRKVHQQMGDFNVRELSSVMSDHLCVEAVGEAYQKYHKGQTLVFGVNVEHCNKLKKVIPGSKVVTAKTKNRDKLLKDFTKKKFKCLINCMVLTEGTDLPLVETIIIARPTRNQSLYTQIVGRGLRPYPKKKYLTLIDCVGVSKLPVCSAPTLFGLNIESLSDQNKKKAVGLLTEMEDTVQKLYDTPSTWIKGVELVNIFEQELNVDTYKLNCSILPDDSLKIPLGNNRFIYIRTPDALNKTYAEEIIKTSDGIMSKQVTKIEDLQKTLENVYNYLRLYHRDSRSLWDIKLIERSWGKQKASKRQLDYIRLLSYQAKVDVSEVDMGKLTKQQAMYLIDHVQQKRKNKTIA